MKIAVDARILDLPRPTGVERSFAAILAAAPSALEPGDEVLALGRTEPPLPGGCGDGVRPVALGGPRSIALWRETHLGPSLGRLGADVLWSPVAAIPVRTGVPRVATIHEVPWAVRPGLEGRVREAVHRVRVRVAASAARRIVCPSRSAADQLTSIHPAARSAVRVVPHAVPERFREPGDEAAAVRLREAAGLPPGPFFLHVGGARARKNVPLLLDAFGAYRRVGGRARLVLAGPGAPGCDVPEAVSVLGYVEDDLLVALYDGAIALIVSSESEGFGIPVLEAMARGTPVAAVAAGGLPEAADGAALLLEPGEKRALASAMRRLDRDPALRAELAERGLERVDRASWERSARTLIDVLREAAGER